jgi:hypothetical protein
VTRSHDHVGSGSAHRNRSGHATEGVLRGCIACCTSGPPATACGTGCSNRQLRDGGMAVL